MCMCMNGRGKLLRTPKIHQAKRQNIETHDEQKWSQLKDSSDDSNSTHNEGDDPPN